MSATEESTTDPFAGYSPQAPKPLHSYAVLMSVFLSLAGAFAGWFARSGRRLPERLEGRDLVLLTLASHKASRLIAKDRVTSAVRAPFTEFQANAGHGEVEERARGGGLRRGVGELLICPYCLGMWTSAALTAALLVAPRLTRWVASVLVVFFGADVLQIAYKKAEDSV
jgi:hypothetical protein